MNCTCREQQRLKQESALLDNGGAALLADTQLLHDSTRELRSLQAQVQAERLEALAARQQTAHEREKVERQREESREHVELVAVSERQLESLAVELAARRAAVSSENIKVCFFVFCSSVWLHGIVGVMLMGLFQNACANHAARGVRLQYDAHCMALHASKISAALFL